MKHSAVRRITEDRYSRDPFTRAVQANRDLWFLDAMLQLFPDDKKRITKLMNRAKDVADKTERITSDQNSLFEEM